MVGFKYSFFFGTTFLFLFFIDHPPPNWLISPVLLPRKKSASGSVQFASLTHTQPHQIIKDFVNLSNSLSDGAPYSSTSLFNRNLLFRRRFQGIIRNFHFAFRTAKSVHSVAPARDPFCIGSKAKDSVARHGLGRDQKAMICPISKRFLGHFFVNPPTS